VRTDLPEVQGMKPLSELVKIEYDMDWAIANKDLIMERWKAFVVASE